MLFAVTSSLKPCHLAMHRLNLAMHRLNLPRPILSLFHRCPNWIPFTHPSITTTAMNFRFPLLLCTVSANYSSCSSAQPSLPMGSSSSPVLSSRLTKKSRQALPGKVLKHQLDMCSRQNDLKEALRLYDDARVKGIPLSLHHYNSLLYLCSSASVSGCSKFVGDSGGGGGGGNGVRDLGLDRGFEIFTQMSIDEVAPNEATFTNLARLAASKEDPEMAFDLIKKMKSSGIAPRLRSYGPALFGFCKEKKADRAYEVDAHMVESGVLAEEPELSALLNVSVDTERVDKVYEMLHRLRVCARQVSEDTAKIVEEWFLSKAATRVGMKNWDADKVKEGVVKGGGGWHGQGWLGSGKWKLVRTQMDKAGVCSSCKEQLVCIDLDPKETEKFASLLATLACEREKNAAFVQFQEWLQQHGPFDAVIDGANVSLVNQKDFSFSQLHNVVKRLQLLSPTEKLPLVVLHRNRVYGGPAHHPKNKQLLESWEKSNALYATPPGSNDDWYWLYAAVNSKCLLVTNDEMRDHLFELLGTSFFPRWKEKHQVRLACSRSGLSLHMPPPYSIVIQESENGSWHVPTITGDDITKPREWLCITRTVATHNTTRLSRLFSNR
ncbi:Proteinaceous RNase P 1, chloroplastic/mitochondrial [Dionaea muscipula]